jgi:hypothetical protein
MIHTRFQLSDRQNSGWNLLSNFINMRLFSCYVCYWKLVSNKISCNIDTAMQLNVLWSSWYMMISFPLTPRFFSRACHNYWLVHSRECVSVYTRARIACWFYRTIKSLWNPYRIKTKIHMQEVQREETTSDWRGADDLKPDEYIDKSCGFQANTHAPFYRKWLALGYKTKANFYQSKAVENLMTDNSCKNGILGITLDITSYWTNLSDGWNFRVELSTRKFHLYTNRFMYWNGWTSSSL